MTNGVTPPPTAVDASFKAFTPKLAFEYRPSDATLAYASVTKSFKSGDVNLFANVVAGEDPREKPESIWAYEAGFRPAIAARPVTIAHPACYYYNNDYHIGVPFAKRPS